MEFANFSDWEIEARKKIKREERRVLEKAVPASRKFIGGRVEAGKSVLTFCWTR